MPSSMKICGGNRANKEEVHYYFLYMHVNTVNNKRYIGMTYQNPPEKRWKNGQAYNKSNPHLRRAIATYGWASFKSVILEEGYFTAREAGSKEDYYINYYDALNPTKGYNIAAGGYSGLSAKALPAALKWMLENPEFGIERAALMRKAQRENPERYKETCKKFQVNGTEAIKVGVVCVETGQTFESASVAARCVAGTTQSKINMCCQGLRQTCGSYHWLYLENYTDESVRACLYNSADAKQGGGRKKKVLCVETGEVFESVTVAAITKKLNLSAIAACCRDTRVKSSTHGGYQWRYV